MPQGNQNYRRMKKQLAPKLITQTITTSLPNYDVGKLWIKLISNSLALVVKDTRYHMRFS
jgi:hypothetical protein